MTAPTKTKPRWTPLAQQSAQSLTLTKLAAPDKLTATNVGAFLFGDAIKEQIRLAAPQHLKPERLIRMALTTVRRTPALLDCDPMSLVACIVQASELGLELSGPLGQAFMIPRRNHGRMEACFQIGYRGFLKLANNSGQVAVYNARAVEDGDHFSYIQGSENYVEHRPRETTGLAKITHFYAILRQKGQGPRDGDCEVWPVEKMVRHRDRFRSDKFLKERNKNYQGTWDTDFEAMGKKTLIRELAKRAPLSAELMSLAARDEYTEIGLPVLNSPAEFALPTTGANLANGHGQHAELAHPDTLDEIDTQIQRTGISTDEASAMHKKYLPEGADELSEAAALEMLAELSKIPDREAP